MNREVNDGTVSRCVQGLKSVVAYIDFLEDEKERAYADYLACELECEGLRKDNERLMFALGHYNARQLNCEGRLTKARRRYLSR